MTTKEKVAVVIALSERIGQMDKRERKISSRAKQLKKEFKKQYKELTSDEKLMYQDELKKILFCLING